MSFFHLLLIKKEKYMKTTRKNFLDYDEGFVLLFQLDLIKYNSLSWLCNIHILDRGSSAMFPDETNSLCEWTSLIHSLIPFHYHTGNHVVYCFYQTVTHSNETHTQRKHWVQHSTTSQLCDASEGTESHRAWSWRPDLNQVSELPAAFTSQRLQLSWPRHHWLN